MGPGDIVESSDTWEENWLFKRQQLATHESKMGVGQESVSMLIPNPESHVSATIGNR